MTTISISEFRALIARNDWSREQDHEVVDDTPRQIEECDENGDYVLTDIPHAWGWASLTSRLDGVEISYTETFSYDEHEPDTFEASDDGQPDTWRIVGVTVIDEDGDALSAHELADYLSDDFARIDYSGIKAAAFSAVTDIDYDEDSDMDIITIEIDNAPDIRFSGELVAKASSSDDQAMGRHYSGQTGRWTELYLYRTAGGRYVCHQIGRTRWQGERDRHSGAVCDTLEEVIEFFGHRWLAKELYAEAGIDAALTVD